MTNLTRDPRPEWAAHAAEQERRRANDAAARAPRPATDDDRARMQAELRPGLLAGLGDRLRHAVRR